MGREQCAHVAKFEPRSSSARCGRVWQLVEHSWWSAVIDAVCEAELLWWRGGASAVVAVQR